MSKNSDRYSDILTSVPLSISFLPQCQAPIIQTCINFSSFMTYALSVHESVEKSTEI